MSMSPISFKPMDRLPEELKPSFSDFSYRVAIMDLKLSLEEAVKGLSPETVKKVHVYAKLKFQVCKQLKLDALKDSEPDTFSAQLAKYELDYIEEHPENILANFVKAAHSTPLDQLNTLIALFQKHLCPQEPQPQLEKRGLSPSVKEPDTHIKEDSHTDKKSRTPKDDDVDLPPWTDDIDIKEIDRLELEKKAQCRSVDELNTCFKKSLSLQMDPRKINPFERPSKTWSVPVSDFHYGIAYLKQMDLTLSFEEVYPHFQRPLAQAIQAIATYANLKLKICKRIREKYKEENSKDPYEVMIAESELEWIRKNRIGIATNYALEAKNFLILGKLDEDIEDLQHWLSTEPSHIKQKKPKVKIKEEQAVKEATLAPVVLAADKPLPLLKASQFAVLTFFSIWTPRSPIIPNFAVFQNHVKKIYQKALKEPEELLTQKIAKLPSVTAGEKFQFMMGLLGIPVLSEGLTFETGSGFDERGQTDTEASASLDRQISDTLESLSKKI